MPITVSQERDIINPNSMNFEEREAQLKAQEEADKKARRKMKDSPFSSFYQFNREHSKEMIWLATTHPKANGILLFLLDQMDNYNAVMCSNTVICEALGIGRTTVSTSIKVLKEHSFIKIYKSGNSNVYAVNKSLAWSSWGTNHQYAKFDAKIIISKSEQEKPEKPKKPEIVKENIKRIKLKQ